MALSWRTLGAIPRLADYAAAAAHEASVTPIRGDEEGRKPLGRRDQKWRRIKREGDGSIIVYHDWGNNVPFIRYLPNGELHLYDAAWSNKASHNEVIREVTGLQVYTDMGHAWVRCAGGEAPLPSVRVKWDNTASKWVLPESTPEPAIFVKNEQGRWQRRNSVGIITHQVNRKGANAVRKRYASGLGYLKALGSLRREENWSTISEEVITSFAGHKLLKDMEPGAHTHYWHLCRYIPTPGDYGFHRHHAEEFAKLLGSDDPAEQNMAFLWAAVGASEHEVTSRAEQALIMWHRDEWLKEVIHEPGVKAIDRYRWAFRQQD
jgi:hypothetical protein